MLEKVEWFKYLSGGQKELVMQAYSLVKIYGVGNRVYEDYSFVVFPMAKAYEGFLRKLFLDRGLINQKTYDGDRFRIGKALNPDMPKKHRGDWWLYDDLVRECGGERVPKTLWMAWKQCRNRLFHYFPKQTEAIGYQEAREKIEQLSTAMKEVMECKIGER